ncbi:MAG: class I SAM-dependent methyltransferase [Thermoguttaceae bacterium]|jgi:23S rRNA (cytosine1962-C5)-methyltransferase
MFCFKDYQLLDFGSGRRLERFGDYVLDRPCPAVEKLEKSDPPAWDKADAFFEDDGEMEGRWICRRELPDRWTVAHGALRFELKRTPFGQIGLFPEQAENWDWIDARVQGAGFRVQDLASSTNLQPTAYSLQSYQQWEGEKLKILNLFAYTGGSTLAAAAAGAEVLHVDAANNIVAWARRNADLSGLGNATIHWITEDALKFVKRELKRNNRYDALILDPPSYGHGRRGEVWRLTKHLPYLLEMCGKLTAGRCRFILLTCHTPGYDSVRLADMLMETIPDARAGTITAKTLTIRSADGRELPSGSVVRWTV